MKVAVLCGPGRIVMEDWPPPVIGADELLVRLRGCGLCGSDIAKVFDPAARVPAVLGHELVASVVEAGPAVTGFVPGDRVVVAHHVPCGDCHYCRRGSESMCPVFKASHLDPGGFAELVRVPDANVRAATFRLPDSVSDEAGSFVEPLACCLRALRRTRVAPGDTAVVVGLGSIGCLFVQLLKRAGAVVVGAEPLAERAGLAKRLGADAAGAIDTIEEAVREATDGRGADLIVVTGGGADVLARAGELVRDGGAIHYFAGGGGTALPLALRALYHRELTISATYSSSPASLREAFDLIVAGDIAVEQLISHRQSLTRLGDAVELMRRREALKVYVTP